MEFCVDKDKSGSKCFSCDVLCPQFCKSLLGFCQQFANNEIQSLFPVRMQPVQHSRIKFTPAYHSLVSKV